MFVGGAFSLTSDIYYFAEKFYAAQEADIY